MINQGSFKSSLVEPYEFADDLCWFYLKKLPEIESRDKVRYSELRNKRTQLRNSLIQKGMIKNSMGNIQVMTFDNQNILSLKR